MMAGADGGFQRFGDVVGPIGVKPALELQCAMVGLGLNVDDHARPLIQCRSTPQRAGGITTPAAAAAERLKVYLMVSTSWMFSFWVRGLRLLAGAPPVCCRPTPLL